MFIGNWWVDLVLGCTKFVLRLSSHTGKRGSNFHIINYLAERTRNWLQDTECSNKNSY